MKIVVITKKLNERSGWGRYSLDLIQALHKAGHEVIEIHISSNPILLKRVILLTPWYVLKIIPKWRKIKEADCLHCLIEPYCFLTAVLSFIFNKKYFITAHGSYTLKTLNDKFIAPFQMLAYRRAKNIISISNFTKNRLKEFIELSNIVVVPNGGPDVIGRLQRNPKPNSILSVGALKWRKGHHKVLEAVAFIKKEIPDVMITIIGNQNDFIYTKNLKEQIDVLGIQKNVQLLSNISETELDKIYSESKIFVLMPLSSRFDFEGFGLVYLEANSVGLPTVGALGSGAEESIKDGQSGFLIDPEDRIRLVQVIRKLLTDVGFCDNISKGALDWASSLTWDKQVLKYINIYKKQ